MRFELLRYIIDILLDMALTFFLFTASFEVDKSMDYDLLPSPIRRVFYLSSEGSGQEHEVMPQVMSLMTGCGSIAIPPHHSLMLNIHPWAGKSSGYPRD